MTDIHSHILFGVDDGARTIAETREMLREALAAGVTRIIATPHVYMLDTDVGEIHRSFVDTADECAECKMDLSQGYECNYRLMMEDNIEPMLDYRIEGTQVLLIEPPSRFLPESWEGKIVELQSLGMDVIIAHPERCIAFQEELTKAERMLEIGCELQISAGSLNEGMLSHTRRCAVNLLKKGLISHIASDAHRPKDYRVYGKVMRQYSRYIRKSKLVL